MNIKLFNNKFYLKGCTVSDSKRNLSFLTFPAEPAGFSEVVEKIDQVS